MQPRLSEPATDVGHGACAVECRQHTHLINEQKSRRSSGGAETNRRGQSGGHGALLQPDQMLGGRLMGHQNEPCVGPALKQGGKCPQENGLIRWPG